MPFAPVSDAELYYEEVGSGPPLILTPGGVQNGLEVVRELAALLAVDRRVIAYDRRFAGRSRSALVAQTWDLAVRDLVGLMDHLEIDQADLGGGATGAAISIRCAAQFPERVRSVFASNVNGGPICTSFLMMPYIKSLEIALATGLPSLVASIDPSDRYRAFVPPLATADGVYRAEFESMDPEAFAVIMRKTITALFGDDFYVSIALTPSLLDRVEAPCLILHDRGDDIHPRYVAERVASRLADTHWSDVGSFRHRDMLRPFADAVLAFLREIEPNVSVDATPDRRQT